MDEYPKIIAGGVTVLGFAIPVLVLLANRALKENDKKITNLDAECNETRKCLKEKAVQIARLEEAIERLDKIAERCGK